MPYPASVSAAGAAAEFVYDLRDNVGRTLATTKQFGVDALPTGVTYDGDDPNVVLCNVDATFSRWDWNGHSLQIWGNHTVVIDECEIKVPPQAQRAAIDFQNAGTPVAGLNVTVTNCTVDGSGAHVGGPADSGPPAAMFYSGTTSHNLTVEDTKFIDIPVCAVNWTGPGTLTMRRIYETSLGTKAYVDPLNSANNTHCDQHNLSGGTILFEDILIDCADGDEDTLVGTITALFLLQQRAAGLDFTGRRMILLGRDVELLYTIQAGHPDFPGGVGRFIDCILQVGSIDYLANVNADVSFTNCSDFDTATGLYGTTAVPWSSVTASGGMTLAMGMAGNAVVGAGASGAMTLTMGMGGTVQAFGPVIGSGAMTLTMGMAGEVSQAVASGDMVLSMGMAGTATVSGQASAAGDMTLTMGMSGAGAVGATLAGDMVLTMGMAGGATASGLLAQVRGNSGKTARPKSPKTIIAQPVGS